jgi:hypothetical protein
MAIQISWGNEAKTFTLFEFIGKWTWEEYHATRKQGIEMVNSVSHVVNIVVDFSKSSFFPSNLLSHFGSSVDQVPRPFDLCIIVTGSTFVGALANVLSRVKTKVKFRVTKTREEAYKLVAAHDAEKAAKAEQRAEAVSK